MAFKNLSSELEELFGEFIDADAYEDASFNLYKRKLVKNAEYARTPQGKAARKRAWTKYLLTAKGQAYMVRRRASQREKYVPVPRQPHTPKTCSVAGCDARVHAKGMCGGHYHHERYTNDARVHEVKKAYLRAYQAKKRAAVMARNKKKVARLLARHFSIALICADTRLSGRVVRRLVGELRSESQGPRDADAVDGSGQGPRETHVVQSPDGLVGRVDGRERGHDDP